jgi:predicted lipoprotein
MAKTQSPLKSRRMLAALCLTVTLAGPSAADVADVVQDNALPGYHRLTRATATLAAIDDCTVDPLRDAWNDAFDAWLDVAHLRLGPVEDDGRVLAIAFWPDAKGIGARQMAQLLKDADPAVLKPDHVAELSVAVRGLFGMERLLYADQPLPDAYACALTHALADDLARMASEIERGWQEGFAAALTSPGPGQRYLNDTETRQALMTALITGIEFNADSRVGRPLGTFDKPRPERAEARASGRSKHNIIRSLNALRAMAHALHGEIPQTDAAFARAIAQADGTDLAGLDDPQVWLKAEILGQSIRAIRDAAMTEIAPALQVGVGFNAADGD